eukprot:1465898-Rhodomonas_salina.1
MLVSRNTIPSAVRCCTALCDEELSVAVLDAWMPSAETSSMHRRCSSVSARSAISATLESFGSGLLCGPSAAPVRSCTCSCSDASSRLSFPESASVCCNCRPHTTVSALSLDAPDTPQAVRRAREC